MTKYAYSVIRFVPSPVRGEFVNLGVIVGSERTGEWAIDVVGSRSRASKLDDENVFPMVASDLQRLQSMIESYSDPDLIDPPFDLSDEWLCQLSRDSRNLLQYTTPKTVVAESAPSALEKLWKLMVVEPVPQKRSSLTRRSVISRYVSALERHDLDKSHIKRHAQLETSKTHAAIDVVVHNGAVKEITQCWSLQIKDADSVTNDIKSWGWTIRTLRDRGGLLTATGLPERLEVPGDVSVGVVYAESESQKVTDEALEVFNDKDIQARCVPVGAVEDYAEIASQLVRDQKRFDL
ncbi:DUF3037 domain-containing protein [Rosistilla oblonga]|uniref:DUF3037 domain-containing protein n=1 Tax=Rosistilla oblonga TaxID=2527990 RepID=UPI003A9755B3